MGRKRSVLPDEFPPGLSKKDGRFYFVTKNKPRKWLALGTSFDIAKEKAIALKIKEDTGKPIAGAPNEKISKIGKKRLTAIKRSNIKGRQHLLDDDVVNNLLTRSKASAKRKNLRHSLSAEDIKKILQRSGGKCEVTGILFDFSFFRSARNRPWIPTLDRINNDHGYTPKNCRAVCNAVNIAINEWGESVLMTIAEAICSKKDNNCRDDLQLST